jgi:hypothetical protein
MPTTSTLRMRDALTLSTIRCSSASLVVPMMLAWSAASPRRGASTRGLSGKRDVDRHVLAGEGNHEIAVHVGQAAVRHAGLTVQALGPVTPPVLPTIQGIPARYASNAFAGKLLSGSYIGCVVDRVISDKRLL